MSQPGEFRLVFLLFDYFPFGGLQRDCVAIASRCAMRGHDVTVFTRTWRGEKPAGLKIELFGRRGLSNEARNRHWLRQLRAALPAGNFDGVIGFNKLPGLDAYYGADPCYVAKARELKPFWYRWLPRYRHFAALERAVFARGARTELLVLTARDIPQYQRYYGTEHGRFHLLPPNVTRRSSTADGHRAARARVRPAQGWSADERIILFIGSDFRRKGLERALMAFASLNPGGPRQQFVIIGDCAPGRFAALARSLGVAGRTHFLGGRSDVADWMLAADALLHPAHVETAGIVLLEAITCGLPVVTTEACGYAPHVAAAGGKVLPAPFDQTACDRALAELLKPDVNAACRIRALEYAAREDLYRCHERVVELIEATVERKRET